MKPTVRQIGLSLLLFVALPGCTKLPDYLYKVTALGLSNVDNSGINPVVGAAGPILARAYGIQLKYTTQITGSTSGRDPYDSGYELYTKITRFTIFSTTDFDEQHPAGASLNAYFYYSAYGTTVGAADSIPGDLATSFILASYRTDPSMNSWQDSAYLILMQPPTLGYPGPRTFIVNVAFADSTQLTDSVFVNLD